jgi:hypothetical protein
VSVSSYEGCIAQFPGVEVIEAKYYGSYQGEFLCKIKKDGEVLYIHDWYGSCSGCDSFEREFDYEYDGVPKEKAVEFARPYVDAALPRDQMLAYLYKNSGDWDDEKKEMIRDMEAGF